MSVSADTYIVISLMFAVFAAVAAVGTSVVLGAGFERLRAGFEIVRKQSGFFADAIYKLDMRTAKLDEETAKLKLGLNGMGERVDRTEKTATFLADSITSIEHRILSGSPIQSQQNDSVLKAVPELRKQQPAVQVEQGQWARVPAQEQTFERVLEERSASQQIYADDEYDGFRPHAVEESHGSSGGLTTLLSRYFTGETSGGGKGVVYH